MLAWQLDRLEKNGPELLRKIKVSDQFIKIFTGSEILTDEDVEEVDAQNTNSKKVNKLLDLIKGRDAYNVLIDALEKTRQLEAANLLKDCTQHTGVTFTATSTLDKQAILSRLIVGDDDCSITKIVEVLDGTNASAVLEKDWRRLARKLGTSAPKIAQLERKQDSNMVSGIDIVEDILVEWVMTRASDARLVLLLEYMADLNWSKMADLIRKSF